MSEAAQGEPRSDAPKGRVLIVEDEAPLARAYTRVLVASGYAVESALDGKAAVELLGEREYDAVVSDISMPEMDGVELLRSIRARDSDLPVILMTGGPSLETAVNALEYGALRYLIKPVETDVLRQAVQQAVRLRRMAQVKRQALALLGEAEAEPMDLERLQAGFDRALASLWLAVQPIIRWSARSVLGYEVLMRTGETTLPTPTALLETAERLGRLGELGWTVRRLAAASIAEAPPDAQIFLNLHPLDLTDDALLSAKSPLAPFAERVTLEITERAHLDAIKDVRTRVLSLRRLGYRIAVDDLGAGYAGLNTFALLEPEVVKLDMWLVRNVHREPTKQKIIRSMTQLCLEMGKLVVAEGIETAEEREMVVGLGCDVLQGYLFAAPARPFPPIRW